VWHRQPKTVDNHAFYSYSLPCWLRVQRASYHIQCFKACRAPWVNLQSCIQLRFFTQTHHCKLSYNSWGDLDCEPLLLLHYNRCRLKNHCLQCTQRDCLPSCRSYCLVDRCWQRLYNVCLNCAPSSPAAVRLPQLLAWRLPQARDLLQQRPLVVHLRYCQY